MKNTFFFLFPFFLILNFVSAIEKKILNPEDIIYINSTATKSSIGIEEGYDDTNIRIIVNESKPEEIILTLKVSTNGEMVLGFENKIKDSGDLISLIDSDGDGLPERRIKTNSYDDTLIVEAITYSFSSYSE